jgi:hypothetical protein
MAERLFLFIQLEFPWVLGPPDGRYLLRARAGADPERVVVLGTLGAGRVSGGRRSSPRRPWPIPDRSGARGSRAAATPEPAPVPTARATIVDPVSLSAERQAHAWLADLDAGREAHAAVAVLNRVLYSHRISAADPYVHEVSPAQALVIRAGWGEGEQVADGRWLHAHELGPVEHERGPAGGRRRRTAERSAALRHQERLAELLGARGVSLLCEDLALRARLDLDQGRISHAAVELDGAFNAALAELPAEGRQDLAIRIAELEQLRGAVALQAQVALSAPDTAQAQAPAAGESLAAGPQEDVLRHALERLEAALRARTAGSSRLRR